MKKILLLVLAMLTISSAEAQIKVSKSQASREVIWKSPLGGRTRLTVFNFSDGDQSFTLSFTTSNQFDDPIVLDLGNKANAIESLTTLANLSFDTVKTYSLSDNRGVPFSIYRDGLGQYFISRKGYAGDGATTAGQLSKMLAALIEWQ